MVFTYIILDLISWSWRPCLTIWVIVCTKHPKCFHRNCSWIALVIFAALSDTAIKILLSAPYSFVTFRSSAKFTLVWVSAKDAHSSNIECWTKLFSINWPVIAIKLSLFLDVQQSVIHLCLMRCPNSLVFATHLSYKAGMYVFEIDFLERRIYPEFNSCQNFEILCL